MAIVSRDVFEGSGVIAELGTRLEMDRYTSASKHLQPLATGGRMFLVTVRPGEQLWLIALLDNPQFDGIEWVAADRSGLPITDITHLRSRLRFKSGKGITAAGSLGQSLQTPRVLTADDVALLLVAITGAASDAPDDDEDDDEDYEPREQLGHRIELAKSTRSKCATCGASIMKGVARVAELFKHGDIANPIYRYHHIECAVDAVPLVVRNALASVAGDAAVDAGAIARRVEDRLERERAERRQRYEASAAAARAAVAPVEHPDGALASLLAQLADAPDDAAVLAVLADELQARSDARGELIATQLALAGAKADAAAPLIRRRDELMMELAPKLETGDRCVWATGFVRRIELVGKTAAKLDEMVGLWRHPSLPFVRELRITFFTAGDGGAALPMLVEVLPRTLRRLEIADNIMGISPLVAALPELEQLVVVGRSDLARLAHPRLAYLELVGGNPGELVRANLPALTHLRTSDAACEQLANAGWLGQLVRLDLHDISADQLDHLARGLHGRKLARLELTSTTPPPLNLRPRLAALCDELVCAAATAASTSDAQWARHTGKPEWGRGKIVRRFEGKLEIKFPKIGAKVFRADAPFLALE